MLRRLLPSSASGWGVVVLAAALGVTLAMKDHLEERVTALEEEKVLLTAQLREARRTASALGTQAADLQALLEEDRKAAAGRAAIIMQARPLPDAEKTAEKAEGAHGLDKASQARVLHHFDNSFDRLRR